MNVTTLVALSTAAAATITAIGTALRLKGDQRRAKVETEKVYADIANQFAQASATILGPLTDSTSALRNRVHELETQVAVLSTKLSEMTQAAHTATGTLSGMQVQLQAERQIFEEEIRHLRAARVAEQAYYQQEVEILRSRIAWSDVQLRQAGIMPEGGPTASATEGPS